MDKKLLGQIVWLGVAGLVCLVTALQLMGVVPAPVATAVVLTALAAAWFGLRRLRR